MQRRAAAIYFVLFLAIGAGSFGYISVVDAQRPEIDVQGQELGDGDTLRIGDRIYVASVSEGSGELAWTNQSALATASLENNATTTYNNQSWTVVIENRTDVSEFDLREELNVSAILLDDPAVENETATFQGDEYVVYPANETADRELVRLDEYLPAPETRTFTVGDEYEYVAEEDGQVTATVTNVTTSAAELTWTSPQENTISLSEGGNVTLGGTQYVAHFPDNSTVILSENVDGYLEDVERQDYFTERKNGLWGIVYVSLGAAIILLGAAYLPVKD
ncbi:hypothetical protein [Halorientalis regularis]|jgi:hypothetical protein|uniref:Uncharacterized protein n=1 Tax=Halorientalis regularis TaxID=660518 RepID=A0A1G7KSK0_9EURY|nr:hypothetical protein [Halorientalis regularis]SDF40131.1 hypothetical protein SAMN05216218_10611 [Halorientalis regularis]